MRIGYVCNRYPAISNTFIMREVQALRRAGTSVDVFSVRRPLPGHLLSAADREEHRSTTFLLPATVWRVLTAHVLALACHPGRYFKTLTVALRLSPPGLRGALWQLFYFAEAVLLWRECRRRGISHLHAHFAYVASDAALLAARLGRWSWSFSMHGPPEFYEVAQTRLPAKVRAADAVVCISDFCRSQLMAFVEEAHWSKLQVVHCGLQLDRFVRRDRDSNDRKHLRVLAVGRLVPVKGHTVLLDAVAELARRGTKVEATIVGDGPLRKQLEQRAAEHGVAELVSLPGAVGQADIGAFYDQADVFCLPSFAEGLPVVLMEAMAMELPVVSTRIMGIPELVEDGLTGLLVAPARADKLADALEELAQDPERRATMGKQGRHKVANEFDIEDSAARLSEIYARLAA